MNNLYDLLVKSLDYLPKKELITYVLHAEDCYDPIGAMLRYSGCSNSEIIDLQKNEESEVFRRAAEIIGFPRGEEDLINIARMSDCYSGSQEDRWKYMRNRARALSITSEKEFYELMIEVLNNLEERKLVGEALVKNGSYCSIGALANDFGIELSESQILTSDAISYLCGRFGNLGTTRNLLDFIVNENDTFEGSPEARWWHMREMMQKMAHA